MSAWEGLKATPVEVAKGFLAVVVPISVSRRVAGTIFIFSVLCERCRKKVFVRHFRMSDVREGLTSR